VYEVIYFSQGFFLTDNYLFEIYDDKMFFSMREKGVLRRMEVGCGIFEFDTQNFSLIS